VLAAATEGKLKFQFLIGRIKSCHLQTGVRELISRIKDCTDKPVALGFGISHPEQARRAAEMADGVIVGSAIVKMIGEKRGEELLKDVGSFVRELKKACC
jgi:tryptophan synthase alpha chain